MLSGFQWPAQRQMAGSSVRSCVYKATNPYIYIEEVISKTTTLRQFVSQNSFGHVMCAVGRQGNESC